MCATVGTLENMEAEPLTARLAKATLAVDPVALRSLLDRLQHALSQPLAQPAAPAALAHDRRAVADSVRVVLEHLGTVDLHAMRMLSGIVREYRTSDSGELLRNVFDDLQASWRGRVQTVLGTAKIARIVQLLTSPVPDLLRMLGRQDTENAHSDMIAWLLTPRNAPTIAPHALRRLAMRLEDRRWSDMLQDAIAGDVLSVRREVVLAREFGNGDAQARVDITVSGPGFLLAIENKVWSHEHHDQTRTYWESMRQMRGVAGGLFLSPSGLNAASPEFKPLSYLELVSCLVDEADVQHLNESERLVLASYLKTLRHGIIRVEMRAVEDLARTTHL